MHASSEIETTGTRRTTPRWCVTSDDGRATVALDDGEHVLGASLAATVLIDLPWGDVGVVLEVTGEVLRLRAADARLPVRVDGKPVVGWRELVADGRTRQVSIGDVSLSLSSMPDGATSATRGSGVRLPIATKPTVVAAGCAAVLVLLAWSGASASLGGGPVRAGAERPAAITEALPAVHARARSGLESAPAPPPGVRIVADERGFRTALGMLADRRACAVMDRLRREWGEDRFVDRTVCLPAVRDHASEWIAGSGLSVEPDGDGLRVTGTLPDPTQRDAMGRSVEAMQAALPNVRIRASIDVATERAPAVEPDRRDALLASARRVVADRRGEFFAQDGRAGLVLGDGRTVHIGADLVSGVRLRRLDAGFAVVDVEGRPESIALQMMAPKGASQ